MAGWKGIVGEAFSAKDFDAYCHTLQWTAWRPSFIALHNTASPSLAQRPNGLTKQHIKNLEAFYRDKQGWKAGPHLFVDDRQIWVFTPLTVSGVHSPSWNKIALGIEMLGNFETEAFDSGRGLKVRKNAVAAMATLVRDPRPRSERHPAASRGSGDDARLPGQERAQARGDPGSHRADGTAP